MRAKFTPEVHGQYQHHSGRRYQVMGFANENTQDEERFPVTVIYFNLDNGTVWSRPFNEFIEKFEPIADQGHQSSVEAGYRRGMRAAVSISDEDALRYVKDNRLGSRESRIAIDAMSWACMKLNSEQKP